MSEESVCRICDVLTKKKCTNCHQAFYCSVQHQKQDWQSHKHNCHPFKIAENEEIGRFLLASRNIKPFEIILKEAPIVRGPSQITGPVCLGCLNGIEPNDYINCQKCGWPLCGAECSASDEHKMECELTLNRGRKVNIQEFTNPHPMYQCISTLRCLLLKRQDRFRWEKFDTLESLENTRRGSMQWKTDLESVGKFIPKFFNTDEFSEDTIMRAVGTLQINGHEVPSSDPPHVAVFHYASLLEHSCTPTIAKSFTKDGHIVLWAPKMIRKNEHLSICYSDALWGTADRQKHLMHTKLFKCNCPRCRDVTEYSTYYSALKCLETNCKGFLLPVNLNMWHENWNCNECKIKAENVYINSILEKAGKDIHAMDKSVENCYKFLNHYNKWLPKNHFYMSEVKIQLVQELGKGPKELIVISDEYLNIKMEYARHLIELYETLAPCEGRILGILCFELHSAIAEHTRRVALQTSLSPKNILEESLMYVEKAINYLQHESTVFAEGLILQQAKINRDALRMVIRM